MKAVIDLIKAKLLANATIKEKFKKVELVGVQSLGAINRNNVPYIGLAWTGTTERWLAQKKEQISSFELYVISHLQIVETAITGDSKFDGMITMVEDVMTALRNETFSSYLSKPLDIRAAQPTRLDLGDNVYLFVNTIQIETTVIL